MQFERPTSLSDAFALLKSQPWDILSGGTDYYPGLRDEAPKTPILDISGISDLRAITRDAAGWRIGALATWTDLIHADLPAAFDALKQASREVGSVQVQNRATLAGNLCNASPAADGVPPLLCLDASVEIGSADGVRTMPLSEFILGNRRTALHPSEMLTAILIPATGGEGRSSFVKLGARRYLVISIAMVAARLRVSDGVIDEAAIAVGSCSEVAMRLTSLEAALAGQSVGSAATLVSLKHLAPLSPISDIRAPDRYRTDAAVELVRRAVAGAAV